MLNIKFLKIRKKLIKYNLSDKVIEFVKSDPEPQDNSLQVKTIVGSTIVNFVDTSDKEVVIGFVNSFSNNPSPILFEAYMNLVSISFITNKNIIFGKIRFKTNDYPKFFEINEDNHNLFFVPSYDKEYPVRYNGKFEYQDMEKFITTNLNKAKEYYLHAKKEEKEVKKEKSRNQDINDEDQPYKQLITKEIKETKSEKESQAKKTCDQELCTEPHELHENIETITQNNEKSEL